MPNNYSPTTASGKDLFNVSSAFQKAIRRGDEEQALHWGFELWNSTPSYSNYLWKRMLYIVSEDIGLANPSLVPIIWTLYQMYLWHKKNYTTKEEPEGDEAGKMFWVEALLLLVRSPKSRLTDNMCLAMQEKWFKEKDTKEIPDYALGIYTRAGRAKGRRNDFFFRVEAQLNNMGEVAGEDEWAEAAHEIGRFKDKHGGKSPSQLSAKKAAKQTEETEVTARPRRRIVKPISPEEAEQLKNDT